MSAWRPAAILLSSFLLALLLFGAPAAKAQTFSVSAITANRPNIGKVAAAASGVTTFRISTGAAVSVVSGNGGNIASGTKSAATVTIRCTGTTTCSGSTALVKIWPQATVSGRAQQITGFSVASGTGTVGTVTVNGDGTVQFAFTGFSGTSTRTFIVGADLPILGDDASTSTSASAAWGVGVAKSPTVPGSPSRTSTARATVNKALSLTKLTDLSFGAVVLPATGTSTVLVDATTGTRSIGSGTAVLLPPAGSRASFTVGGQASSTFSISVPATMTMNRAGGGSLAVTLSPSASGAQTLSALGSFSLGVGGTISLASSTPTGDYSGSFNVTVDYN